MLVYDVGVAVYDVGVAAVLLSTDEGRCVVFWSEGHSH